MHRSTALCIYEAGFQQVIAWFIRPFHPCKIHLPSSATMKSLWPFKPPGTLTCYHIDNISTEYLLFIEQPLLIFSGQSLLKHIEQGREMVECLSEPHFEEGCIVGSINNSMDKHIWVDSPDQLQNCIPWIVLLCFICISLGGAPSLQASLKVEILTGEIQYQ